MVQITLDDQEANVLAGALKSYLSDLRMEIAATDSFEFREALKEQEAVLAGALEKLGHADGGVG